MAEGFPGRTIVLLWGAAAIAGVRQKSIKLNNAVIDITSDDDAGWRKLLSSTGEDTVEVDLSGVTKGSGLKNDWFQNHRMKTLSLTYPNGGVLSGTFLMAGFDDTGPYKDATTFTAKFQSSGIVTWTPGSS